MKTIYHALFVKKDLPKDKYLPEHDQVASVYFEDKHDAEVFLANKGDGLFNDVYEVKVFAKDEQPHYDEKEQIFNGRTYYIYKLFANLCILFTVLCLYKIFLQGQAVDEQLLAWTALGYLSILVVEGLFKKMKLKSE